MKARRLVRGGWLEQPDPGQVKEGLLGQSLNNFLQNGSHRMLTRHGQGDALQDLWAADAAFLGCSNGGHIHKSLGTTTFRLFHNENSRQRKLLVLFATNTFTYHAYNKLLTDIKA